MPRLWFNRTYATTWHLIGMIRANADGVPVHVLGSSPDPSSPVLAACDEIFAEPEAGGARYVEWALRTARQRHVDVLVPRAHMADLAAARAEFAAIGTTVLCPDTEVVDLFADKAAGYRAAAALGLPVPPHRVVHDGTELRAAYAEFAASSAGFPKSGVCMKPVCGVGGEGYRRLTTEHPPDWDEELAGEVRSLVRVDAAARALDAAGGRELLVMPFLDGVEISVDVLADVSGRVHAAIGRRHDSDSRRRVRTLVDDVEAREIAEKLVTTQRVAFLSNTQVKWWHGTPYLLELNTRAAGGLFQTRLAGVNLPWAAIQLAMGNDIDPIVASYGARYTEISGLVRLGSGT